MRNVTLATAAWIVVGVIWYVLTGNQHPTRTVAVGTTATLTAAFAIASFTNLYALVPHRAKSKRTGRYWGSLLAVALLLTGAALILIRVIYTSAGFTPGPFALHYAIDFFGMTVHIAAAYAVARLWRRTNL